MVRMRNVNREGMIICPEDAEVRGKVAEVIQMVSG